jgi:DNA-binding MarR family transcriptional regulator
MELVGQSRAPAASLVEISRVLEETARLVREHAGDDGRGQLPASVPCDPRWVRAILDLRDLRRELLGFEASDAALAMLLALYVAGLEGRRLHQTALALAARVPETTALRVTHRFLAAGIFTREGDEADKRLNLLALSEPAATRVGAYLAAAARLAPVLV